MRWLLFAWVLTSSAFGQTAEARSWADYWADTFELPRELVYAVIEAESAWNPHAVSHAGAVGLMQLMPDTAVMFRVQNRFDIAENVRGGVAYLAWLKDRCGGDWRLILASYHAGHRRVLRRGLNYSSAEVRGYVERIAYLFRRNRGEALRQFERRESR